MRPELELRRYIKRGPVAAQDRWQTVFNSKTNDLTIIPQPGAAFAQQV
jgi:hypothetical protein